MLIDQMFACSVSNLATTQLTQEMEWILGEEGERERARQRWSDVCFSIWKQGELESANNGKIGSAMANCSENRGDYSVKP